MSSVEKLGEQIVLSNSIRRHFERTPEEYSLQIVEEAQELVKEIQQSLITGDVFPVAGEIGDLYILLAQLCEDLGINPAEAMAYKAQRNQYKYPDYTMNNGYTKEEAHYMAKRFYREVIGGEDAFNHAYMDFLATVSGDSDESVQDS